MVFQHTNTTSSKGIKAADVPLSPSCSSRSIYLPGLQDITAHVDFTAVARAGLEQGLSQPITAAKGFSLEAGITDISGPAFRLKIVDVIFQLPMPYKKLISPAEMGELFKVLVMSTGMPIEARFARVDRSHRL